MPPVSKFGSRPDLTYGVRPDLGPSYLGKLSSVNKSCGFQRYIYKQSSQITIPCHMISEVYRERTCNGFVLQMAHFYSKKSIVKKSL